MAALPVTKLAGLLVKTLSKPMAKRIKHEFARFPFTQKMLIGIGQTTHVVTSRLTIWSAGYKVKSITPLESEKAMSKGADFLGESIVFLVSGGVVVWEYNRSKEKEKSKEEKRLREIEDESEALQAALHALDIRLEALEKVIKAQNRSLLYMGERYVEPEADEIVPIAAPRKRKKNKSDTSASQEASDDLQGKAVFRINNDGQVEAQSPPKPIDMPQMVKDLEMALGSGLGEERAEEERLRSPADAISDASDDKMTAPSRKMGWWGWWPF